MARLDVIVEILPIYVEIYGQNLSLTKKINLRICKGQGLREVGSSNPARY